MLTYPQFDPVIFKLGPLAIRWYGLMYLIGFLCGYALLHHLRRLRNYALTSDQIGDLLFYIVCGVILGGRLGYVLFYNPGYYIEHPLQIPAVWQGGMSFHGGLLGVIFAVLIFCRNKEKPVFDIADMIAAATPIGLCFGRIGNFINGELWGRATDLPWGMVFPGGGHAPRHPSQLYEALLEGVVLFLLLYWLHRRQAKSGVPFFTFFAGYGFARFIVEFVREPDQHLGLLPLGLTMGQYLSLPMIVFGVVGLWFCLKRGPQ